MIDEVLELGFDAVELGYDTRLELVEGIQARVAEGAVRIDSVHNFWRSRTWMGRLSDGPPNTWSPRSIPGQPSA